MLGCLPGQQCWQLAGLTGLQAGWWQQRCSVRMRKRQRSEQSLQAQLLMWQVQSSDLQYARAVHNHGGINLQKL